MKKTFTTAQLIIALLLLIIITIIPSVIYIYNFGKHNTSSDPTNWGTFGDFIGGTTNVIIGIINIGITVYIAYLIKTFDDNRYQEQRALESQRFEEQKALDNIRHKQNIDLQNEIFIRTIREEVFKDFNLLFQEFSIIYRNEGDLRENVKTIKKIAESYVYLRLSKNHIFNTFSNDSALFDNLEDIFERILDFFEMNIFNISEGGLKIENINSDEYVNLFSEYVSCVTSIKVKLIKEIITNEKTPDLFTKK